MPLRLTVAHSIDVLADQLADELSRPLADPFAPELVAVPGDGIRSWLTARLASRLGETGRGDGVVANVQFVFPSALVKRALGRATPSAPWSVGALTWVIHDVLRSHADRLGIRADAVRCRAIADLFDRYALHRPLMVRAWERGADVDAVDAPLAAHQRWQSELWRLVVARIGPPSDVEATAQATCDLAAGRLALDPSAVPGRVFLVGLAGLPDPHLRVLAALSRQVDVHVLAPTPSLAVWERLHLHTMARPLVTPLRRDADETASSTYHPLNETWGRAAREAHLVLTGTAVDVDAAITRVPRSGPAHEASPGVEPERLLARLQHDVRADLPPPGAPDGDQPDDRLELDPHDRSIQWHACHGPTRQAEVLRDIALRLLQEQHPDGTPRYQPRDITVLCPDVPAMAPLVEAAFVGDPPHGIPAIPLRVADRSLRQQNPLIDATVALLDLIDGRFRASQVLSFAEREPVARRFGFGPEQLELLSAWTAATHVRWGADPDGRRAVGISGDLGAHTWRDGLDQLMVGAALADPVMAAAASGDGDHAPHRFGPGYTVPAADVEGDAMHTAGALADLLAELHERVEQLARASTVAQWCESLAGATAALFDVADLDSWQRRDLDAEISAFADEASITDSPAETLVPATELADLLTDRLTERPGRVRFGTGAVTLSSLTAQRGVPHPVICLLGLDGDLAGSGAVAADDLTQSHPCVGDRDARLELRAQLLDALLAAGDHLVLLSTGRDVRTNARVPSAVPLAELADVVDATARPAHGGSSAMRSLLVEHPRQGWAEVNFRPGGLGVEGAWSFDRSSRDAARARRRQHDPAPFLSHPLPAVALDEVHLGALERSLKNPAETLVRTRLGVSFGRDAEPLSDLVPLAHSSLEKWALADSLLRERLAWGDRWNEDVFDRWSMAQRRSGAVPPLVRGELALTEAASLVDALLELYDHHCGDARELDPEHVDVAITVDPTTSGVVTSLSHPVTVVGVVGGVRGNLVVGVTPSRLKGGHTLAAWVRAAALTLARPDCQWEAVQIGKGEKSDALVAQRITMRSPDHAREALAVAVDLHERATRSVVPAFPQTSFALYHSGPDVAAGEWQRYNGGGENDNEWIHAALGPVELADLLAEPAADDEQWGADGNSRIEQWAHRIWSTVERTAEIEIVVPDEAAS